MAAIVRLLVIATLAVPLYSVAFAHESEEKPFTVGKNVLVSSAIGAQADERPAERGRQWPTGDAGARGAARRGRIC